MLVGLVVCRPFSPKQTRIPGQLGQQQSSHQHPVSFLPVDPAPQVHGLPSQQRRNRGHQGSQSAPSGNHTAPVTATSHAEDPFHQHFRVFDVEQSAATGVIGEGGDAPHAQEMPTPAQHGAGMGSESVLLDEAYVQSRFLPMVSNSNLLSSVPCSMLKHC